MKIFGFIHPINPLLIPWLTLITHPMKQHAKTPSWIFTRLGFEHLPYLLICIFALRLVINTPSALP
jgi:hypothetical protein